MTAATAPVGLTPLESREGWTETLSDWRDEMAIAQGVAWDLLVHDVDLGPGIAAIAAAPLPRSVADRYLEPYSDGHAFLYHLIDTAAELGYRVGASGVVKLFDPKVATHADVSRAVAALARRRLVEDGEQFPECVRPAVEA